MLHDATNDTELLLGIGPYNSIINASETAELAANESREAADQSAKVTMLLIVLDEDLHVDELLNVTLKSQLCEGGRSD